MVKSDSIVKLLPAGQVKIENYYREDIAMKIKRLSSVLMFLGLSVVAFGQKYIPEDDLYYQPKDKNPIVEKKKQEKSTSTYQQPVTTTTTTTTTVTTTTAQSDYDREVDAYNRRYSPETTDTIPSITLDEFTRMTQENEQDADDDDTGYYLNGFEGTQSDLEYAERIHRFHNPKFTIHISDPAYTDIYFLNPTDWNVYIDNSYAFVTPTWTNPWYWNYTWAPYSYSSLSWRWNFGFGSWGFSWGYGYPGWGYNPYWGWARPWYPHWGWAGHHHYPGYYPGHRPGWNNGRDIRYSNGGRTTYGNYGSSNRYSGGRSTLNTRPSSTGNKYTPGSSSSSRQPIMRETNSNRGRTRIGTSSGNSTYSRPSGTTNRRSTYTPGSSSGRTSGSSSRVRNSSGGRSTYTPSSSQRRESGSSYSPSTSRSSGSSGSVGRSSGGSRGRTR